MSVNNFDPCKILKANHKDSLYLWHWRHLSLYRGWASLDAPSSMSSLPFLSLTWNLIIPWLNFLCFLCLAWSIHAGLPWWHISYVLCRKCWWGSQKLGAGMTFWLYIYSLNIGKFSTSFCIYTQPFVLMIKSIENILFMALMFGSSTISFSSFVRKAFLAKLRFHSVYWEISSVSTCLLCRFFLIISDMNSAPYRYCLCRQPMSFTSLTVHVSE